MSEPSLSSPCEAVPATPGIKEIRFEPGSDGLNYGSGQGVGVGESPSLRPPGIRKVSLRAEIDTSPPFGSVKEAVTRFGGHGPWVNPLYKFGDNYNGDEEFDIKRVEEETAELEKDLIVKELETLDVLEELTTTKRIVEELKRQLQDEALKCMAIDQERYSLRNPNCPSSSPDFILTELKRAKLNLGKTMADLGAIQASVECLTKKMRREKEFIGKTRDRLTQGKPPPPQAEEPEGGAAASCVRRTAEMRWVAAKKMGEAAAAAEAVALAEIAALSSGGESPKAAIMRKLKEATEEVRLSRRALEEALNRVDLANRKQLAVEEAMEKWVVNSPRINAFSHADRRHVDYRHGVAAAKPALKTTVSMRDVLSKKQVSSVDQIQRNNETQKVALSDMLQALRDDFNFASKPEKDRHVSVSVTDVNNNNINHSHNNNNNNNNNQNKQFWSQRKKFGFIQISLPLTKPSKKKTPSL